MAFCFTFMYLPHHVVDYFEPKFASPRPAHALTTVADVTLTCTAGVVSWLPWLGWMSMLISLLLLLHSAGHCSFREPEHLCGHASGVESRW